MSRIASLPPAEHHWHFADGSRGSLTVGSVSVAVREAMPRKPRLKWPRDVLQWFAVLEQHPDRLGIFADWLDERAGGSCEVTTMLAPAVRYAQVHQRWPLKTPGEEPRYCWELIRDGHVELMVRPWCVPIPHSRIFNCRVLMHTLGASSRGLRRVGFCYSRNVRQLPMVFRYLAAILSPEPPA